jgi:hypothetical protein
LLAALNPAPGATECLLTHLASPIPETGDDRFNTADNAVAYLSMEPRFGRSIIFHLLSADHPDEDDR